MAASCTHKNPLIRTGTSQDTRQRPALRPEHFGIDERRLADLVLIAERFSQELRYYNAENLTQDNWHWQPFFGSDITVLLAGLSKLPVDSFRRFHSGLHLFLTDNPPDPVLRNHFKLLFYLPLLLLQDVGRFYKLLPQNHALRDYIERLAHRDIEAALLDLVRYFKGVPALADPPVNDIPIFQDTPLDPAQYNTNHDPNDTRIQLPTVVTRSFDQTTSIASLDLNPVFFEHHAQITWTDLYAALPPDPIALIPNSDPYLDGIGGDQPYDQIFDALNYSLLTQTFEHLYQALTRITQEAERYVQQSLTEVNTHQPHYGLFLAFLQLFEVCQQHLNTLTEAHLNYYYQTVLQLCLRKPVPDTVHLLFTLNKHVDDHLLPTGTRFKAGKDAHNKAVVYELLEDIVVNRAEIAELKALFVNRFSAEGFDFMLPFSAPVANSLDGLGEELPDTDPQWRPFGPHSLVPENPLDRFKTVPEHWLGFAIADKQLFLREGNRTITVTMQTSPALPEGVYILGFKMALTAEEGWFESRSFFKIGAAVDASGNLTFTITLNGDDPPIVPYDPDVHGQGYDVDAPILKIGFAFGEDENENIFSGHYLALMQDLRVDSLTVDVSVNQIRMFTLQNGTGALDTAQPFLPFGARPEANTPLILGSSEVFSKRLNSLVLHTSWDALPNNSAYFLTSHPTNANVHYLKQGAWVPANSANLFAANGLIVPSIASNLSQSVEQILEDEPYGPASKNGFVRFSLQGSFGHKEVVDARTIALINLANNPAWTTPANPGYNDNAQQLPLEPFTPKINELTLSYTTIVASPTVFMHLHPFGHVQDPAGDRLLPELSNEGELYIGLRHLEPPQRVSILFQTVEGSANPLKLENTIEWKYLAGNTWQTLENQYVDDKTRNLTGSGTVGLAIPAEADTQHTLLPNDLHWIRLSVQTDADALNNLLTIDTQAAMASFVDQGNDPSFLALPLPPETISKLVVSDAAIKKNPATLCLVWGQAN